jgi:hypothetical protein
MKLLNTFTSTRSKPSHPLVTQGKGKHGMLSSLVSRQDNFVVEQLRRTKLFSSYEYNTYIRQYLQREL